MMWRAHMHLYSPIGSVFQDQSIKGRHVFWSDNGFEREGTATGKVCVEDGYNLTELGGYNIETVVHGAVYIQGWHIAHTTLAKKIYYQIYDTDGKDRWISFAGMFFLSAGENQSKNMFLI